jgi:hypothetical protein
MQNKFGQFAIAPTIIKDNYLYLSVILYTDVEFRF